MLHHRNGQAQFKALGDPTEGVAELIVAGLNNIDRGDDVIDPGAFTRSIAKKPPKGVWSHEWGSPVAKTLEARELQPGDPAIPEAYRDQGALYVKAAFNLSTQRGREAFSDIQFGTVDEFSVGYIPMVEEYDNASGLRHLKDVDWIEWSPVLAGMNPNTGVLSTKELDAGRVRLADETDALLDDADRVMLRFKSLYGPEGMRTKEGRTLSAANKAKIEAIHERMGKISDHATAVQGHCDELLSYGNTGTKAVSQEEMQAAFTRFMQLQSSLRAKGLLHP